MDDNLKPRVFLEKIEFKNSDIGITLKKNEKVIIVGPNNSGKSQTLREILTIADQRKNTETLVIKDLAFNKNISNSDFTIFLQNNATYINPNFHYLDRKIHVNYVNKWDNNYLDGDLTELFIKNITAKERLDICQDQNSVSPDQPKTKAQHILYDDDNLMQNISSLFQKAFGKELMFDFKGGSKLPIHVGEIPRGEIFTDRQSNTYRDAVRKNPKLENQGDGVKSYAGILFETLTNDRDIILLDEPEAFLHPPQMRKLGETLSSEHKGQMIVATHSSDIMRGFLEGTKGNIKILRIQRDGEKNIVYNADADAIQELWKKPNLRFSNALDGMFHEQVIICEDDSDCRLYNYTAEWLKNSRGDNWLDTSYVPSGGKSAIHGIASVLRKVGVPVKAVFDIDFLSDEKLVTDTVQAFGGVPAEILPYWKRVDGYVRKGIKPKTNIEIKEAIRDLLDDSAEDELKKSAITACMKQGQSWSMLKLTGEAGLPGGDAYSEYRKLINHLKNIGIYIVPVGEIERFNKHIPGHGPKFVATLLAEHSLESEDFDELKKFTELVHKGPHSKLGE